MARPKAQPALSPEQVQELASLGCTDSEIATLAAVSESTLKRSFEPQLRAGRAELRRSLRRAQVKRALDGSDTMLIWLGKQYLEQRDKQEISGPDAGPIPVQPFNPVAALAALAPRPVGDSDAPGADQGDHDG